MALPLISPELCMEITGLTPADLLLHWYTLSPPEQAELEALLTAEITTNGIPDRYEAWLPSVLPPSWDAHAPHISYAASELDTVTSGEVDRLAFHWPPRHAKSESITIRYPVYHLERNPIDNVLVTGYNEKFAKRFSRKSRNIADSLGILDTSRKAVDEWYTKEGGMLMARGVGSPPTGVGFNLIIIDDPIKKREEADSETVREKMWDWYADDIYTRLQPGGKIILVATLWHEDDICHRIVESEPKKWFVRRMPALAEPTEDEPDLLGRAEGDALWPTQYSAEDLLRTKNILSQKEGQRSWIALYQQRPAAREGSFFLPDNIVLPDTLPPPMRRIIRAWDVAATKDGGDYTVGIKLGLDTNGSIWILDLIRGQYSSDERDNVMLQTAVNDGYNVVIIIPQDPASSGKDVVLHLIRLFIGFSVKVRIVTGAGSLESRAFPASVQVNNHNVKMLRAFWNTPLKSELRSFPTGKHDDIVSCLSDGVNELGAVVQICSDSITTVMPEPEDNVFQQSGPVHQSLPQNRCGGLLPPIPMGRR